MIEADEYAKELSRYIHLNPVRAKMVEKPHQYAWASYPFYIGDLIPPQWLVTDFILSYFGNNASTAQKQYRDFVDALENTDYESPLKNITGSAVLVSGDFVQTIKNEFLKEKSPERDLPGMKAFISRLSFETVAQAVESEIGQDRSLSRGLKLYFCHKYTGRTLKEIGEQFGVGQSAVSQASRRIKMKTENNEPLKKTIKKIEIRLDLSKV